MQYFTHFIPTKQSKTTTSGMNPRPKRTNRSVLHNFLYHTHPHLTIEFIFLISLVPWWHSILRNLLESLTENLWKIWGTCHVKKRYTKNETRLVIPQLSDIWRYLWLIRKTPAIQIKIKNQLCLFAFFFYSWDVKMTKFCSPFSDRPWFTLL